MDNDSSSTKTRNDTSSKTHWGVLLPAWIAFVATVVWTFALGLVLIKLLTSKHTTDVPNTLFALGYVLLYSAPVIIILTSISVILAKKYDILRLVYALILLCCTTVWVLIASCCYGLLFTLNGPAIVIFLIASFMLYVATTAFMIAKKHQMMSGQLQPVSRRTIKISSSVAYVLSGIACVVLIGRAVVIIVDTVMKQIPNDNFAVTKKSEETKDISSPELVGIISDICSGNGYKVLYQIDVNSGIFECNNTVHLGEAYSDANNPGEVYIASYESTDDYGFNRGSYQFLGSTYEKTVDKYFASIPYIYRGCDGNDCLADLVIVTRAHSIDEAIRNNVERIYDYVQDIYSQEIEDGEGIMDKYLSEVRLDKAKRIMVTIFYDEQLESELSTRDYFLIGPAVRNSDADTMPFGALIGENDWLSEDSGGLLKDFDKDVRASSLRVRNALANNVYAEAKIDDGDSLTLEALRERLISNISKHPMSNWVVNGIMTK